MAADHPKMKKMCPGCPYNYGDPLTEQGYNYGCLPSVGEIRSLCDHNNTAWACHSAKEALCAGYAEMFPERDRLPLQTMEGVHADA